MGKSPRNKTLEVHEINKQKFEDNILDKDEVSEDVDYLNKTICGDAFSTISKLPENSIDLIFADPPYNMDKEFRNNEFSSMDIDSYEEWTRTWLIKALTVLKPTGSIYICSDWQSSSAVHQALIDKTHVRNRITWQREKGRGAKTNWKNSSEDIWFATVSDDYTFNVNDVKKKKDVKAPYTDSDGNKKDWDTVDGDDMRLTHPSNIWTEMTVPFWSMHENTEHPTQKPEKLVAKALLASSNEGDVVLDPFLGSGTTSVVAKKLNRQYIGIESDRDYCILTEKRISETESDSDIQGYVGGFFWPRNSKKEQKKFKRYLESQ